MHVSPSFRLRIISECSLQKISAQFPAVVELRNASFPRPLHHHEQWQSARSNIEDLASLLFCDPGSDPSGKHDAGNDSAHRPSAAGNLSPAAQRHHTAKFAVHQTEANPPSECAKQDSQKSQHRCSTVFASLRPAEESDDNDRCHHPHHHKESKPVPFDAEDVDLLRLFVQSHLTPPARP